MALSNWDTLAFNSEGESIGSGVFTHHVLGSSVEIYKNWAHVADPKAWRDGAQYVSPFIAKIESGVISIAGFDIQAERHDAQNSIFLFAEYFYKEGEEYKHKYFGGIGCYGFILETDYYMEKLGLKAQPGEEWTSGSVHGPNENYSYVTCYYEDGRPSVEHRVPPEMVLGGFEDSWLGVTEETKQAFFKWLEDSCGSFDSDKKAWIEKCKKSQALRFNQGDAFFADNLGTDLQATEVGQQKTPTIGKLLGNRLGND